jgi:hypothetical protein
MGNGPAAREGVMNHSMYSADRGTHLKIVVIALTLATLVASVGVFARASSMDLGTVGLLKAGQPAELGGQLPTIR